jgi:hypothetical protein
LAQVDYHENGKLMFKYTEGALRITQPPKANEVCREGTEEHEL